MVTQYPAKIDTAITLPKAIDNVTPVSSKVYNDLRDAVIALEEELGVKPSGIYGTVRTRLDFLEANGGGGGGSQTLSQVLALGNDTGGHNIVLTSGDAIVGSPINMNGKIQLSQQSTPPSPVPVNAGTIWVQDESPTNLIFTNSAGTNFAVPLPETPSTPHERNVLTVDNITPELNFPAQLVYDGTHIWGLKGNTGLVVSGSLPVGSSNRASGGGVFKIDPVSKKYLEEIQTNTSGIADLSDASQQDIFLKMLWTGSQLFIFGFNPSFAQTIIREIIRGTDSKPTTFGPRIVASFADLILGATWDGSKIWLAGSSTGNIFRVDPSNPGVAEVTLLIGAGGGAQDIIYDSSTAYPDNQSRLFVADPNDGFIYRIADVHTLTPFSDASASGTSTRLVLAAGFLFGGEASQLTRYTKNPLALDIFTGGPSFPLGVSYDPITGKGFISYVGAGLGNPTIDRITTSLVVEATATINPNSYGAVPFLPLDMSVVGSDVWFPDEGLSNAGLGDVFAIDTTTLVSTKVTRNLALHYAKPGEHVQYVNDPTNAFNCTWDGLSSVIAVAQAGAAPITVTLIAPTDGQRLTIIDAFGLADPTNSITIVAANIHGDSSPITSAFGSITLISVGLGVWEVESRNPASGGASDLATVLTVGNTTGGTSIIITPGDSILGTDSFVGQGGDVPITAGAGASGFSGGTVIITGGAAGALANSGFVNIKGGSAPATGGGGTVNISGGDALSNGNGGPVVITGGTPSFGGGGAITLTGGPGNAGVGGDITITGGAGDSDVGGTVTITGGTTGTTFGGNVVIKGGDGLGPGFGGAVNITSGNTPSSGSSGFISILTPSPATSGRGGDISIQVSPSTGVDQDGGNILVQSGNATGTGTGGSVTIRSGGSFPGDLGVITLGTQFNGDFITIKHENSPSTDFSILGNFSGSTPPTFTLGYSSANATNATGGSLALSAQGGGSTSGGGAITITAGAGGTTSGSGGNVTVQGGTPTSGNGGSVLIFAKNAVSGNNLGGSISINSGNSTGSGSAGDINISGGSGGTTGFASNINLTSGNGGSTSGSAGNITLLCGNPTDGDGGTITLTATNGSGTNRFGGGLTFNAGNATGSGTGGTVAITAGNGVSAGSAGNVTVKAGNGGTTSTAGSITLTTGNGGSTSGDSGNINLTVGTTSFGNGGSITLTAGDGNDTSSPFNGGDVVIHPGAKYAAGTTGAVRITGSGSEIIFDQQTTRPVTPASTKGGIWLRDNTHQTMMFATGDGYDLPMTWTYPPTQVITANRTAINGERTWYTPAGGTFTLTAPVSPVMGHKWAIKNVSTDGTSITVSGNGNNIEDPIAVSLVASFTFAAPLGSITWEFDGIRWLVV